MAALRTSVRAVREVRGYVQAEWSDYRDGKQLATVEVRTEAQYQDVLHTRETHRQDATDYFAITKGYVSWRDPQFRELARLCVKFDPYSPQTMSGPEVPPILFPEQ